MARADGTDDDVETGDTGGGGADLGTNASDARLTALLRADSPMVYPALQELRARHRPRVLAYARRCTTSDSAAAQLAAQAFTLAARETARGVDQGVPVRLQLLLLTGRLAASWARDDRAGGLDSGLLLVLNTAGGEGPVPPLLAAFQSLPLRAQGLIWYRVVEQESEERTAAYLGVTRQDVVHETPQALHAMAQACLRARLAASDDPRCGDFRRLIEESVRPDNPRTSADLQAHMAYCGHCTAAFEEQSALRDQPRTALAEGLLPWAGPAYAGLPPAGAGAEAGQREGPGGTGRGSGGGDAGGAAAAPGSSRAKGARQRTATWPPSRRYVLASAALGVALAPFVLFLLASGGGTGSQRSAGAVTTPSVPAPQVTVTATVPGPTVTPSPSATSRPPSPSPRPRPSRTAHPTPTPTPTPSPTVYPPGASYAQVVNAATGGCLDIAGDFDDGTDVDLEPCGSADTQRWRVDASRGVVQSAADPDFCLDSRGSVDNGVGIWHCDSVDGRNGRNLTFTVDPDGVIRPAIAIETGLTPHSDGSLSFDPLTGGTAQQWRAGAA
ncbi:ricin-type beta-trefoil lectin domain protein [Streptomyces anandii]|uniref:ricin-type beta-trefoil lectin domain protein n=1 Tax=Streptomyces anandii TaxID=285454 RepID=UPI0037926C60